MKKNNKKGFVLAETIAISVVVMTSLVIVYTQFMYLSKSYSRTFNYNSVNNMYLANNIKMFINNDGLDNLINGLTANNYIDITSCPTEYFTEYIYCQTLLSNLNIKQVIFTKSDLDDLKNNLSSLSEKMKQFINYINDEENDKYRIIVEFKDETYSTLLMDGTDEGKLENVSLIATILDQYIENSTVGLVKETEDIYYYKGTNDEVTNNYLWYGGHVWRILEIDKFNNTLKLITQQPLTAIQPSDAIWTSIDLYNNSYINQWLNEYFWNSLGSSIQNNILDSTFNIGVYSNIEEINTIKKVGILDVYQYLKYGNGSSTSRRDSFLDIKDVWWLGNRYNSTSILYVDADGDLETHSYNGIGGIRPVITISDVIINKGTGTLSDNYRFENKIKKVQEVQVGEYINVPYNGSDNACGSDNMCTFKVISKDGEKIKIVLNGLLATTSTYGSSAKFSIDNKIYVNLKQFESGIDEKYRSDGTFYIGDYPSSAHYNDVQDETFNSSIGLPTIGEMFSCNDIDVSKAPKKFVDSNVIENPMISNYYWTMNRYNSINVYYVDSAGSLVIYDTTGDGGVRPVIFLKSSLNFIGGNGTAQNPYTLE